MGVGSSGVQAAKPPPIFLPPMANRLTDTTIWKNQKWFKRLPILYKLTWKYLTDVCDQAGIWKIDIPELIDDLGIDEFDLSDFIKKCNFDLDKKTGKQIDRKRILQFDVNHIWITGFMTFQYGGKTKVLNYTNLSVRGSEKILKSLNLWELGLMEHYFSITDKPLQAPSSDIKPLEAHKDKEKDKDNTITLTTIGNDNTVSKVESNYLEEVEEPIVDDGTLSPKMLACFKRNFPEYQIDFDNDYKNCIELAKKIAKFKNWKVASVVNGKMDDCLKSWETIVLWVKDDDYYSNLSLAFLNKQWSGLIQKMSKNKKNGTHKQVSSSKSAGTEKLLGILKDDLTTNQFNG